MVKGTAARARDRQSGVQLPAGAKIVTFCKCPDQVWAQLTVSFSVNQSSFLWSKRSEREADLQNILAVLCVSDVNTDGVTLI
jgi:hypothetical protein